MNVKITNNDLLLFKYLFECDFLTREHINNFLWDFRSKSTNKVRLWKLHKANYIKKLRDPLNITDSKSVIAGTDLALETLKSNDDTLKNLSRKDIFELIYVDPKEYRVIEELNYNQIRHDYFLSELRFRMENFGASHWYPDNLMHRKKMYNKIPDGTFKSRGRTFAVELEKTLKKNYSYKRIFAQYDNEDKIDFVIYVFIGKDSEMLYENLKERKLKRSFYRDNFKDNWIADGRISDDFYKKFYLIKYKDIKNGNLETKNYQLKDIKDLKIAFSYPPN